MMIDDHEARDIERFAAAFYEGALWQRTEMKRGMWDKFCANFCREWARGRYAYSFKNDISPKVFAEVIRQHPEMARWIKVKTPKDT